ncbi:MAG: Hsp20/alpha crystallin family protein [Candidatus Brocadiaceae bacterium]|nr:Hsp20/alpha crystallin family protein [Candidatus Brocadiaceae bacterium]
MSIERLDPWQGLPTLQQETNELSSNSFKRFSSTKEISFTQQINMHETEKVSVLNVPLQSTLQEDNVLYIRGESPGPYETIDGPRHIEELHYGYFERQIQLPTKCYSKKIETNHTEEILNIRIIKKGVINACRKSERTRLL